MFERTSARDLKHSWLDGWEIKHIGVEDTGIVIPLGAKITAISSVNKISGWYFAIHFRVPGDLRTGHPAFDGMVTVPGDCEIGVEI